MRRPNLRSRLRGGTVAALAATLTTGSLVLALPAAAAADPDVGPGEVASSGITHLQNNPKNGALQGTGSDLAFQGKYAYSGNYDGFTVYDLSNPKSPQQVVQVYCPGSQNDVSVYGDVLVLSTDSRRTDDTCASAATTDPVNYWEGVKVFDISDPAAPVHLASVATECGSHTHSLAPSKNGKTLYAYVSSYSPSASLVNCQPPHDTISVVKIPLDDPAAAAVVSTPNLFPDGGYAGDPARSASATSGCHDITTYAEKDIAAGACMGDGVLLDIKDRENPTVIARVQDTENFAFWHSATFNNDATKVVFTDELGGGGQATCTGDLPSTLGADGIYDIVTTGHGPKATKELVFKSYYKIPRVNTAEENCVAHNGSLIPVKGKDLMVQSWYQGGVSVFDFTDSANPVEVAWFDRGEGVSDGGTWSTYYYNGYAYSNDLAIGFDTFKLDQSIDGKAKKNLKSLNPQMQQRF